MAETDVLHVFGSSGPPAEDLAREAWLLERAADGEISLFLTSWTGPVVVLGYGQPAADADLGWCRAQGVPVLRRLSGGTGVIHAGDLGLGLSLPAGHPWAKGIIALYGRLLDAIEPALRSLEGGAARLADPARASRVRSPICFLDQLADTLVVDGRKVVGCAQTRRRGAVLVHAAILLGLDAGLYARIFGIDEASVRSGLAPALQDADWRTLGALIAGELAGALGMELVRPPLEPVPDRFLEPYRTERWAPVPPGPPAHRSNV